MDPQKQGGYPSQNYPPQQPQQPAPPPVPQPQYPQQPYPGQYPPAQAPVQPQQPVQQAPQAIGQQGFALPQPAPNGTYPGQPGSGGKSRKKLWIIIGFASTFLILGIIVAIVLLTRDKEPAIGTKITKTYDSPMGIMPAFQSQSVTAGKFKLTSNYVTGADFTREGPFFVKDDQVAFEMITDAPKANALIKSLYLKQDPKFAYNDIDYGAARNLKYDFNSLLGYQYLYDANAGAAGGYIPMIEAAKQDPKKAEANPLITLGSACDNALEAVKFKTGKNLNTTSVRFDYVKNGVRTEATVSFSSRQDIDRAVIVFFGSCFDFERAGGEPYKVFVDRLKENTTKSPTFAYWSEFGKDFMTISPAGDDQALKTELKFEFSSINASTSQKSGETSSYIEKRNGFGLAYSVCRTHPVVVTEVGFTYSFMPEDDKYKRPSEVDTSYHCTTLTVPPQFKAPDTMTVTYPNGAKGVATGTAIDSFRSFHDVVFQIEKYNLDNKRYPGPTEFTALANSNMAKLTEVTQKLTTGKTLVYTPGPAGCVGDCKNYSLTFSPQAGYTLERKNYQQ